MQHKLRAEIARQRRLPKRLQVVLDVLLASTAEDAPPAISFESLRANVAEREQATLSSAALRQRLARINAALETAPFKFATRAGRVLAVPTAAWDATRRAAMLEEALRARTAEALRVNVSGMVSPRARPETLTVMLSYAWLEESQQAVQIEFVKALVDELTRRPERYKQLPPIVLWRDQTHLDPTRTGTAQMDAACASAFLGLIMLSTKYLESSICQREAAHFLTADGENQRGKRCLVLSVNCDLDEVPPRYKKDNRIVQTGPMGEHLLNLWSTAPVGQKHDFVRKIARYIFRAAEDWLSEGAQPPDPDPPRPAPKLSPDFVAHRASRLEHDDCRSVPPRARPSALGMSGGDFATADDPGGIPIVDHLVAWARSRRPERPRLVALLGDFGMGKTVTCQLVTRKLLDEAADFPGAPVPIYFDLRDISRPQDVDQITLEHLIGEMLRVPGQVTPDPKEVITFAREQGALLVFDGLDEVTNKLPVDIAKRVYRELLSVIPTSVWARDSEARRENLKVDLEGPSILISCRSQYFADFAAERGFLTDADRSGLDVRSDMAAYVMLPFDGEQVKQYLRKNLNGADASRAQALMEETYDLGELAARPILLRYIGEMVDRLEQEKFRGHAINITRLYDILVEQAFQRDEPKHVIPVRDKKRLLQALALHLHRKGEDEISTSALAEWLDEEIAQNHPRLERSLIGAEGLKMSEVLAQDFRNATLLSRPGENTFRFGHTSIREYFLADALYRSVQQDRANEVWNLPAPTYETLDFLLKRHEIEPAAEKQAFARNFVRLLEPDQPALLRGLAFRIWRRSLRGPTNLPRPKTMDCSGLHLSQETFSGAAGRRMPLMNTLWVGSNIRQAEFLHVDLTGADFSRADGTAARFVECGLVGTTFNGAKLPGTQWRKCILEEDAFPAADLEGASALGSTLGGREWRPQERVPAMAEEWTVQPVSCGHSNQAVDAALLKERPVIATGSDDGRIRIWDVTTGVPLKVLETTCGVGQAVTLASIQSEPVVAAGNRDGLVRVWNAETGAVYRDFKTAGGLVSSIAIGRAFGREILAAITQESSAHVWDIETGETLVASQHGSLSGISAVAIYKQRVFAAIVDGEYARIWDVENGQQLAKFGAKLTWSGAVDFRVVKERLFFAAALTRGSTIILWEAGTGTDGQSLELPGSDILALKTLELKGEPHLFVAKSDATSTIISVSDRTTQPIAHRSSYGAAVCSFKEHDEDYLVRTAHDGAVLVEALSDGATRLRFPSMRRESPKISSFEGGDRSLTAIGTIGTVIVVDSLTGEPVPGFRVIRTDIGHMAVGKDGGIPYIYTLSAREIHVWNALSGILVTSMSFDFGDVYDMVSGEFRDTTVLALSALEGVIYVVDPLRGKVLHKRQSSQHYVNQIAIAEIGEKQFLAAAHEEGVQIWDLSSSRAVRKLRTRALSVAFGVRCQKPVLACGDQNGMVFIVDLTTGRRRRLIKAHSDFIRSVAVRTIGSRDILVSGGDDGLVKISDIVSGRVLQKAAHHSAWVQTVAATKVAGGACVVSSANDGTVQHYIFADVTQPARQARIDIPQIATQLEIKVHDDGSYRHLRASSEAWRYWLATYRVGQEHKITGIEDLVEVLG